QMGNALETGLGWAVSPTGEITPAPEPHRVIGRKITCLAVSPDGNTVYAGSVQGEVLKVHLTDVKENTVARPDAGMVTAIAVSEDGKRVLVGTDRGSGIGWTP